MEEVFSREFQSSSMAAFTFLGLTVIGSGLGFAFWLDFRRRFENGGNVAGTIVLIAGTLLGVGFGYLTTQPGHFKNLTADKDGIGIDYGFLTSRVFLRWKDVENVEIQRDRLTITSMSGDSFQSPVVYRGEQSQLVQSIIAFMPDGGR